MKKLKFNTKFTISLIESSFRPFWLFKIQIGSKKVDEYEITWFFRIYLILIKSANISKGIIWGGYF